MSVFTLLIVYIGLLLHISREIKMVYNVNRLLNDRECKKNDSFYINKSIVVSSRRLDRVATVSCLLFFFSTLLDSSQSFDLHSNESLCIALNTSNKTQP